MNQSTATVHGLQEAITPVLSEMSPGILRTALLETFTEERASLATIEQAFRTLTSASHPKPALRHFFASWSKTNNSAASVSGLANRMTLLARQQTAPALARSLFEVCASLQRITDEDLGALGGKLHSDLFYTMATSACADDAWLLKSYCLESAESFKAWTDRQRLGERNLLKGLLTTLVHEVYTHGEVEFIHPLFQRWFGEELGTPAEHVRHTVAWVTVHTGGTESNHFAHAVNAVQDYCAAIDVHLDEELCRTIFRDYLRRKQSVMADCAAALRQGH